jgi:hypothetical protein
MTQRLHFTCIYLSTYFYLFSFFPLSFDLVLSLAKNLSPCRIRNEVTGLLKDGPRVGDGRCSVSIHLHDNLEEFNISINLATSIVGVKLIAHPAFTPSRLLARRSRQIYEFISISRCHGRQAPRLCCKSARR